MVHIERSNTILYCARWNETVEFYRSGLGLAVAHENDWFVEFELAPHSFVSIADATHSSVEPGDGRGMTLSLRVADVAAARSALVEAGVAVGEVGTRWGAAVIDVYDPSGNRLEFWSDPAAVDGTRSPTPPH
jgi:catechol 2,3-dioxygenase-like lactoylglutathione lyase family enzyme